MLLGRVRCVKAYVSFMLVIVTGGHDVLVELLACMNMANDSDEKNCIGVSSP